MLRALGSASCENITHETGVRFVTGMGLSSCDITHEKGVRLVTGIGFFILRYHTRDRGYDLIRTLGPASCDLAYESAGVQFVRGIGLCFL